LLLLEDGELADKYLERFEQLWAKARPF